LALVPLEAFVGRWTTRGAQYASPFGAASELVLAERWEWLPGRTRLVHRVDGHVAEERLAYVEVFRAGRMLGAYEVERDDWARGAKLEVEGESEWMLRGRCAVAPLADEAPVELDVRCALELDRAHGVLRSRWEWSQDGTKWDVFRDLVSERESEVAR
jgi:hypothetical protein